MGTGMVSDSEASGKDRPDPKEETRGDLTVKEADDCRFPVSPSGTFHERREWPGDAHDYDYHPKCGQRLPAGSMWGGVDADTPEEAATEYGLRPCSKCFTNSHHLSKSRREALEEHRSLDTDS